MKTLSAAKKRFDKKSSTVIKRSQAFRRHLLTKKTTKQKRGLRQSSYVNSVDLKNILLLLPY